MKLFILQISWMFRDPQTSFPHTWPYLKRTPEVDNFQQADPQLQNVMSGIRVLSFIELHGTQGQHVTNSMKHQLAIHKKQIKIFKLKTRI